MWIYITIAIISLFLIAVGSYFYLKYVPYPDCTTTWDIRFPVTNTFETVQDLVNDLSGRIYEFGSSSYSIFIKDWVIGTVNNGAFYPSDEYKSVTAGTYLLTPISKTNTCQSGQIIIKECLPDNIACQPKKK